MPPKLVGCYLSMNHTHTCYEDSVRGKLDSTPFKSTSGRGVNSNPGVSMLQEKTRLTYTWAGGSKVVLAGAGVDIVGPVPELVGLPSA